MKSLLKAASLMIHQIFNGSVSCQQTSHRLHVFGAGLLIVTEYNDSMK
ncbi:hypothetical protein [Bdellovibrio sp.]